jgi:acetyl esterase/lipase
MIPETPSQESIRLARRMTRYVRNTGERSHPRGPQLWALRQFADSSRWRSRPKGMHTWRTRYGSVPVVWVKASNARITDGAVLWLHGGGFVFGSGVSHRASGYHLSRKTGLPVLLPHYRLAPKAAFPAAADDCLHAYRTLLDKGVPADKIRVIGDSAGGHLVSSLIGDIRREGLPMPAAMALISPLLDLSCETAIERDTQSRDPFVPPRYMLEGAKAYLRDTPPTAARVNVLGADKNGWPPALIQVGGTECLQSDSERMYASLRAAGVDARLQVWPGQVHVFPLFGNAIPEGRAAFQCAADFLRTTVLPADAQVADTTT